MSVVIAGVSVLLALFLSRGAIEVGDTTIDLARAQLAADAAALAAVAESAPGGAGDPEGQAARFARLNGGELQRCLCEPGATAAQVEVSVGSASARSRAAFDPERILPAVIRQGELHPLLRAAVDRLIAASAGDVWLVSGFRTFDEQAALWDEALKEHGSTQAAERWVARPGTSRHESGLAVDLGGDLDLARDLIDRLGLPLTRPLSHEPWHFELMAP